MTTGRFIVFLLVVAALAMVVIYAPVAQWTTDAIAWMRANPGLAELVYAAMIAAAVLLVMPTFLLMVAGGFLFGLWQGALITWFVYLLAAMLTYWIGHTIAREWVEKRIENNAKFQALDHAIHGTGFNIVLLTRLAILIPYNILNYVYGLTKVRFRDYALGTAVGSIPMVGIYVFIGTTVTNLRNLATQAEDFAGDWRVIAAELVLVVIVMLVITRVASRALTRQLNSEQQP